MIKYLIQILLNITLFCLLFFNVFVSKSLDTFYTLTVMISFLILNVIIFKWKKVSSRNSNDTTIVVASMAGLLLLIFYACGFKTGFSANYSTMFKNYIRPSLWMMNFAIVIVCELLRNVTIQIRHFKKWRKYLADSIMILAFILVDLSIATKSYDLTSFSQIYEFFSLIVVQSLSKNILLNHLSYKYGIKPCLSYRLIMDLYIYFVPFTPKLNMFIKAVIMLIYPYLIYVFLTKFNKDINDKPAVSRKKKNHLATICSTIVFALLVILVSREFTYSMIAIGSGSMTGSINKGDAVVYKKIDWEKDNPKVGDIMVFYKNNVMIVHRIIKVYTENGVKVYQTKGDANDTADNWVVHKEECIGFVKLRILWIAWPSVLLNEIF